MRRQAISLIVLALALLLAACGPQDTPTAEPATAVPGIQYRMMPVKTSTPVPAAATVAPVAAGPTAVASAIATRPAPTATRVAATAAPDPRNQVRRIDAAQARAELDGGRAVLVDVRSTGAYTQRHAAGALSLPEIDVPTRYTELPVDRLIILYCT